MHFDFAKRAIPFLSLLAIAASLSAQNLTLTPATPQLPLATTGVAYNQVFSVTGGTAPYTWSVPNTLAGTGLSLIVGGTGNSTLTLSGTPSFAALGTYTLNITVTESPVANPRRNVQATYTLVIGSTINITNSSPLPAGTQGVTYAPVTLTGSGGTGTGYAFSLASGSLPPGLALNGAVISGVPTASGSFTFNITIKDSGDNTVTKQFTIAISPALVITTSSLPNGSVGVSYSGLVEANGGSGPRTWAATGLPTGLSITASSGQISGAPTAGGNFTVHVTVTDSTGSAAKDLQLTVTGASLTITTSSLSPAAVGVAYTFTMTASGGVGTRTWSASGLPSPLTMSSAGTITGTPQSAGSFNVNVSVSDSTTPTPVSKPFTLTISAALQITTASLPSGSVGAAYSAAVEAAGGSGARTWAATGLPAGLSIDGTSGAISGNPTVAGTSTVTVTVTDGSGQATRQFTLVIGGGLTITTASLPQGTAGTAYQAITIDASGGSGARTWSASGLPAGMTIAAGSGVVSGTPAQGGTYTVTVSVADSSGTASKQFTLVIAGGLTITTAALPTGALGIPYTFTVEATGGAGTRTWIATGLPAGLTMTATSGTIAGTPTANGGFTVTVSVSDASGTASKQLTLAIAAGLVISTQSLPNGILGTAYSALIEATGGSGARSWSAAGLPQALTINSSGQISGIPQSTGTFQVNVSVTDLTGSTNKLLSLTVSGGLSISTASLPSGSVGVSYSTTVTATGGAGSTYSWSATGLPPGLNITSSSGLISGSPTTAGSYTVNLTASDGVTSVGKALSLVITAPTALVITTQSLPAATAGASYTATVEATGGTGNRAWSASGLPAGLTMNPSTGQITGAATAAGTSQVTVSVTDSTTTVSKQFTLTVTGGLTITTQSLPQARLNASYSASLQATGGASSNYSWIATGLPSGVVLATNGLISGTPTVAGSFNPNFTVSDGVTSTSKSLALAVVAGLSISTTNLPNAAVGTAYTVRLEAAGGNTVNWRVTSGALPPGLALTGGTGVISGTPIARSGGNYSFTVEANDGASTITQPYTITVLEITTTTLPVPVIGQGYSAQLAATGVSGQIFSLASGQLPAGLVLQATGLITGTPTAGGTFNFAVQVTWQGLTTQQSYTLTIGGTNAVTIVTTTLPAAAAGSGYTAALQATGGSGSYIWQLASGQLPAGITLSAAGVISGIATDNGSYTFVVRAVDSANSTLADQRQLTLTVGATGFTITTTTLPGATVGTQFSVTLTASGGTQPISWTVSAGQLPFGIGLTPNSGLLSGTPLVPGTYTFTVRATDAASGAATRQLSLIVSPGLTISNTSLPGGSAGVPYSTLLTVTGGSGTGYVWSITSGQLPGGLTLAPQAGIITGTPQANGTFQFTVQVADSLGATSSKQFSITIGSALSITTTTLPNGSTNVPYSQTVAAAGGAPPLQWSVSGGLLPPGLQLNAATGSISGTPATVGPYTFTIQVRDSSQQVATRQFGMLVTEGLAIVTASLPSATDGLAYTQTLTASGGTPPYSWTVAVGSLPPGLTLNANGTITGAPSGPSNFSFIIQVSDAGQQSVTKAFTLVVNARSAFVIATPLILPAAQVQAAYGIRFQANGGAPPYSWSLGPGAALPVGLTLDPDGTLSGSPTSAGSFNFLVRVSDSQGQSASQSFSLTVAVGLNITTPSPLPAATAGAPYTASFGAAGGQPDYRFSLASGSLPAGLTLSAAGVIAGTPTAVGTFSFDVQVSDAANATARAGFTLAVRLPASPTVTITGLGENVEPAQQPRINVNLGAPYPVPVSGTVTLSFTPDAVVPADDPAVVFTNGRRTIAFTVDAGATQARFTDGGILQTGTVAGTIDLTVRLDVAGSDITPTPAPKQTARVNRAAPVIRAVRARRVTGGLEVEITGFATSRELTQAVFRFTPIPGSALQTTELTVPLATGARTWYESEDSRRFGSQFTLTQQFNVQGDTSAIGSVTVTISNAQGASASAAGSF